ncbi:MAG: exosome complex protein Rrp42 [Candidatus Helarchaeota archaeon]
MSEAYKVISEIERSAIENLAAKGQRIDGRKFDEFREIKIKTDCIVKAEGSAHVWLGKTEILAGVKVSVGAPYPDTPNEGVCTVNAELIPMASQTFEPGPPGEQSIEVARVVDRGLRHSEIIDKKKLCITPGEKVFIIFIDLYVIQYDGNMFDAGELAAVAALLTTKIPRIKEITKDGDVKFSGSYKDRSDWIPLPLTNIPVSFTYAKINKKILLDPNENEERVLDARFTITLDGNNNICSLQKGADGSLTIEECLYMLDDMLKKVEAIRAKLPPLPKAE